jgi:hypothetical protein
MAAVTTATKPTLSAAVTTATKPTLSVEVVSDLM